MHHLTKIGLSLCLAAAAFAVGCQNKDDDANGGDETHAVIQQSEVPAAVSAGFKKAHPNATVTKVEKETYADGTIHYEYEYTENGNKGEVELSAEGEVLDKH